jgi:hypothetical protein
VRRAAKVDANHDQIVSALRAAGASVQSLAPIGKGCPDLLVATRKKSGETDMFLIEVKSENAKPNEMQKKWHIEWKAPVYVVRTPDEALQVIGVLK